MNVEYLIQVLNNKLVVLKNAKIQAFNAGDLPTINSLEEEILGVQNTISQLNLLLTIDTAAIAANKTHAEVVTSGIEAVQNVPPAIQGPSASATINGYDVSAYATDALYEEKIQKILGLMPAFAEAIDVDIYIQDKAPGSPVTGDMVLAAVNRYDIDQPLLLAIMQNDSSFGTKGIGANTFNPGNVGNTGTATKSFGSWEEGVFAVAEWLSRHQA
jgi:hypothetical protein